MGPRTGTRIRSLAVLFVGLAGLPSRPDDLPPLFRLPVGGRPLAAPLIDTGRSPNTLWFLSEDLSLYALSEDARLLLKHPLERPEAWLAIDPFGRAVVLTGTPGAAAGTVTPQPTGVTVPHGAPTLEVLTRTGRIAWSLDLGAWLDRASAPDELLFGPDGRYLLRSGRKLRCLSPTGRELWSRRLTSLPSCPIITDSEGNFVAALADGSLLRLSPYGVAGGSWRGASSVPVTALGQGRVGLLIARRDGSLESLPPEAWARADLPPASLPGLGTPILRFAELEKGFAGMGADGRLGVWSSTGRLLWEKETGIADPSILAAADRIVVAGKGRASSYSYEGELLRDATITNALAPALVATSGLLFSAGADWVLAAYRYEGRLDPPQLSAPPFCPPDFSAVNSLRLFDPGGGDPDRQLGLVTDIEKRLDSATIGGSEPGDRAVLEAIARGGLSNGGQAAARQKFRLFARPRSEACRVLGEIGSPASMAALADIAASPGDVSVRASALEAIAAIGLDPRGDAQAALALASRGPPLDEELALALVDAVESVALSSGGRPSVAAARSLIALSGAPYTSVVRDRALAALANLARGSSDE